MRDFRIMHKNRTISAFTHLIECIPSQSERLIRCLAMYQEQFLNPNTRLTEEFREIFSLFIHDCECEDCAVAVIQVARVLFDRHSQIDFMKKAKDVLGEAQGVNISKSREQHAGHIVLFRTCLLASNQHKELFWSYIRFFVLATKVDKVCVEFSLENDWNFWNHGIPIHREKEIRETMFRLIPEMTLRKEEIFINQTRLELQFSNKNRLRSPDLYQLVFRLEDEHPLIDVAIDSKYHFFNMPVVTITCRARTNMGRDSHLCLTRKSVGSVNQYLMIPPVDPFIGSQYLPAAKSESVLDSSNARLVSAYGQRRLNTFWTTLNDSELMFMIRILENPNLEKWAFVGSSENANLLQIIEEKVPKDLRRKVELLERQPIVDLVSAYDLFIALPIEGGGSTARQFAAFGTPVWMLTNLYDVPSIFPKTAEELIDFLDFNGLSSLDNLLNSEKRVEILRKLREMQKEEVLNAINIEFLEGEFAKIIHAARINYESQVFL